MRLTQLLSGLKMAVTNEEQQFINRHQDTVRLTALDDHGQWLAQNLVRKGVYSISNDNRTLIKNVVNDK
jgi:predicted secreted protein